MDYTEQSPIILSLCPGTCGLERGFDRACGNINWKHGSVAAYVEIEAVVSWNLVKKMEQGLLAPAPVWTNLKTLNANIFRGKVDAIFGGYPCQPFSVAGKREGQNDPRHLWPFIGRGESSIVGTIRPIFCFFENVPGHLTMGFDEVYRDLSEMGYYVEAGIYSAEEVGAPHKRDRLFILAVRKDVVNANSIGNRTGLGEVSEKNGEVSKRYKDAIIKQSSEDVANSLFERLQRARKCDPKERWKNKDGHFGGGCDLWPARPGEHQYEWEEPRIESKLGFSVNGYNFREDLLRMAGNGVVEQTAEVAFISLYNKIFNK